MKSKWSIVGAERGQAAILIIGSLVVLLAFVGLGIDIGRTLVARAECSRAADAAVLAGAQGLPSASAATSAALDYAARNDVSADATVTVTTPYNGDFNKIEVVISGQVPTLFLGVLAFGALDVGCRAVSGVESVAHYAIFANSTSCDPPAIEISGSLLTVTGLVHSNGSISIPGSDNTFVGGTTYGCDMDIGGSGNSLTPGPAPAPNQPLPVNYDFDEFPCDITFTEDTDLGSVPEVWVNNDPLTRELKDGVYCSTAKLTLSMSDVVGHVTLAAEGPLVVSGSNLQLTALWNEVLFYSSDATDSAMDVSGQGGSWQGIILAPNGTAKVQGSNNLQLVSSIVADRVRVSASEMSIEGIIETPTSGSIFLLE